MTYREVFKEVMMILGFTHIVGGMPPLGRPFSPLLAILFCLVQFIFVPQAAALEVPLVSIEDAVKRLSAGGYVLMMRHAQTESGIGDPPGFKLDDCKTQRNLSAEGREQAKKIGEAFKSAGIRIDDVASSEFCRCKETAQLVFGKHHAWEALNSFFSNMKRSEAQQTAELRNALPYIKPPKNVAWVTHQVNITALTGFVPAAAEIIALKLVKGKETPEFRFAPVK